MSNNDEEISQKPIMQMPSNMMQMPVQQISQRPIMQMPIQYQRAEKFEGDFDDGEEIIDNTEEEEKAKAKDITPLIFLNWKVKWSQLRRKGSPKQLFHVQITNGLCVVEEKSWLCGQLQGDSKEYKAVPEEMQKKVLKILKEKMVEKMEEKKGKVKKKGGGSMMRNCLEFQLVFKDLKKDKEEKKMMGSEKGLYNQFLDIAREVKKEVKNLIFD